jgi:hypothetical protein
VKTTRWAIFIALFGTVAHAAEVYKSTDANGTPTFSDRPDQGQRAERVYVATPRAGRPGNPINPRPAPETQQPAAAQPGAKAGTPANAAAAPAQPTAAELAAEKAKNCQIAKERQEKYSISHRLYRDLGNGEREYMSDADIDKARSQAAADVTTWCG